MNRIVVVGLSRAPRVFLRGFFSVVSCRMAAAEGDFKFSADKIYYNFPQENSKITNM